jgi:hypothetical protein
MSAKAKMRLEDHDAGGAQMGPTLCFRRMISLAKLRSTMTIQHRQQTVACPPKVFNDRFPQNRSDFIRSR